MSTHDEIAGHIVADYMTTPRVHRRALGDMIVEALDAAHDSGLEKAAAFIGGIYCSSEVPKCQRMIRAMKKGTR